MGGTFLGRALAIGAVAAAIGGGSARAASYAQGLDVSNWQGTIDWLQVGGAGYTFAFAKATEGTTFSDVTYPFNRSNAQWSSIRFGAYHYARPSGATDAAIVAGAIAQADHFVDVAQPRAGDLPPVLDLETTGGLSPDALVRWTQAWLDEVAARTGLSALIYASPNFWRDKLGDTMAFAGSGHGLWLAHWTAAPAPATPAAGWGGKGWSFWQWTNCASIPGIAHCVDGDRANAPDPARFALAAFPAGAPASASPPTIVGQARTGSQLAGVPGSWSGGKPIAFAYQWLSCDAAGSGCVPIAGATLPTYVPSVADVGHALALSVTATGAAGSAPATSAPTLAVAQGGSGVVSRPAALAAPQVSGTPQVGATLTAGVGAWSGSPTSFAFAWRRCDASSAGCTAVPGATGSSYVLTPADLGGTISLVVTATGVGGSQTAAAPTTAAIVPAPVPPPVVGSLAAQAGAAGAVATTDGRAIVTWQPGAVPIGAVVSLAPVDAAPALAGTGVSLALAPAQQTLPWPIDVAYASVSAGPVVGFSADTKTWQAVPAVNGPVLAGNLLAGTYVSGGLVHVVTRRVGELALFAPGRWGDPRLVSRRPPVLRGVAAVRVSRQRDGTVLVMTRLSTSSQVQLTARATRGSLVRRGSQLARAVLRSGGFPVRFRLGGRSLVRGSIAGVRIAAVDPWGRRGAFTLSFRVP